MRFPQSARAVALTVAAVALPCASGCLVPLALPAVTDTPDLALYSQSDCSAARAFRVDATEVEHTENAVGLFNQGNVGGEHHAEVCTTLHFRQLGLENRPFFEGSWLASLPPQRRVGWTCGWLLLGPYHTRTGTRKDAVRVALYRPGFELIWLRKDVATGEPEWRPAADATAQARALDELFYPGSLRQHYEIGRVYIEHNRYAEIWLLDPGSAAPAHREVLLFGAAEYDRLADQIASGKLKYDATLVGGSLQQKARELRELANK
jgi:hypothetical protein